MSKMLEAHQIAVSKKLSFEEATRLVDETPGLLRHKVYHHCEEVPVCSAEHNDRIPEKLWSEDWDRYECPECQEEVRLEELHFTPYKIVSDEDYRVIQSMPVQP